MQATLLHEEARIVLLLRDDEDDLRVLDACALARAAHRRHLKRVDQLELRVRDAVSVEEHAARVGPSGRFEEGKLAEDHLSSEWGGGVDPVASERGSERGARGEARRQGVRGAQ